MKQKITPFLWFDRNSEEAMNFYTSIFPDSRIVSIKRYPDGPLEGPMKGFEGKVLTAVFELMGQEFMCLDGGPFFKATGAVSLYVECDTQEEVDAYWNRLAEGGDEKTQQCGWLQDKFGFSWQIIPKALPTLLNDPDPVKSKKVMDAMLKMKKIEVNKLEEAYKQ
jgi:predicted 3-demethylubiquinone-9 3-methyltransferase (glyoxalase superfamily)